MKNNLSSKEYWEKREAYKLKKYIKKSGTSKLEKWLGCEEYEYVLGEYCVKYNNDVTIFNIPKNIIDMFTFEHHTTNKESQE